MTLDPTFVYGNYAEACLWAGLGIVAFVKGRAGPMRLVLAVTLVVFGISDLVEAHTGAWYTPWWLLAWKAACILVCLILAIPFIGGRLSRRRSQ